MRSRTAGVTAAVAVLSVLASAAGHAFVAGHSVPPSVLPQLGLLASLCFLFAMQRLRTRVLVAALSLIQVGVHVVLTAAHSAPPASMDHEHMASMDGMAAMEPHQIPVPSRQADLPMLAMHLGAMLGTLALLYSAARWWEQLVGALGRVLPHCGRIVIVRPARPLAYAVVPTPRPPGWASGEVTVT